MKFNNHIAPKPRPKNPTPSWVYREAAVRMTQRLGRVVSEKEIEDNFWVVKDRKGRGYILSGSLC